LTENIIIMKQLLFAVLTFALVKTMPIDKEPLQLSLIDVGKFIEGFFYGLIQKEFNNIDACLADVNGIENEVVIAVNDFSQETFDGVKHGLDEMGKAIKMIPEAVKHCSVIVEDLTKLK